MSHDLSDEEIEKLKAIEVDSCPWCPDQKPGWHVGLTGSRDDPSVYIMATCGKCGCKRGYGPTEAEVQKYYSSRYSENREMILALWPKLIKMWNWKIRQQGK